MFSGWVSDVAHQAVGHPIAAGVAVFLLAASEAIPVLGPSSQEQQRSSRSQPSPR